MSRSNSITFSGIVAVFALGAGACFAASASGCAFQSADSSAFSAGPAAAFEGERPGDDLPNGASPVEDAAAPAKYSYRGNPLCHVEPKGGLSGATCMPDDDGFQQTNFATVKCSPDSGSADACRLARQDGGPVAPACLAESTATGRDGASCTGGRDCAPAFDCVADNKGVKSCRRYCCAGTCKGSTSQGGALTFCDIQSLVDVNQLAPVCIPLKRCTKLLATGECASTETCAIATEAGDTGCVAIGEKQVGQSCDESHCAAMLTCLGQPGTRRCFKLCKVSSTDCPGSQTCVTNAAFRDADFGICQ